MKKFFFMAAAILAGSMAFAQKKEKQAPPPPPPPAVLDVKDVPPPPPPPKAPEKPGKENEAFMQRNPAVNNISWSDDTVRIRLKSGKEEIYNLKSEKDVEKIKNKYGELPAPPPPPPPPPKVSKVRTVS